jgi:hypothetical protein
MYAWHYKLQQLFCQSWHSEKPGISRGLTAEPRFFHERSDPPASPEDSAILAL